MPRVPMLNIFSLILFSTSIALAAEALPSAVEIGLRTAEISRNPNDSLAYLKRGGEYFKADQTDLALADFDTAIKLGNFSSPLHRSVAHKLRSVIRRQKQAYRQALEDVDATLKYNPEAVGEYATRGLLNYRLNKFEDAKSDFENAILKAPEQYEAKRDYARLLACCPLDELRDSGKAVTLATEACEMTEWKLPECVAILSCAHAEKGDFDLALSLLDLVAETDPELAKPFRSKFEKKVPHRDDHKVEDIHLEDKSLKTPAADSKPSAPIPPQIDSQAILSTTEAATRVGEYVIVDLQIRSSGSNPAGFIELYSAPTWQEAGCFFIRFSKSSQALFRKLNIVDLGKQFQGSKVRVRGKVEKLQFLGVDHAVIYVESLDQFEVVSTNLAK